MALAPTNPQWISDRLLVDKAGKQVIAGLGMPENVSEHEWRCPYRVARGRRAAKIRYAHGMDALQALIQGLVGIRAALDELGIPVQWQGASEMGDSGFPVFVPQVFGLEFTRSLERMVYGELERFALAVRRRKRPSRR